MVEQNTLTASEEAAIRNYVKDMEENGSNSDYTVGNYEFPRGDEITFWDKQKVLGGTSANSDTYDQLGLGYIFASVVNYQLEDVVTMVSSESTSGEQVISAAFTFTPLKFLKPFDDVMGLGSTKG
ncbi:hypothetical protein [Oceanobacillus sp. J11TS1]|uniref:hypothetical protein n=1 Tax=Oceanobacillus sp. J11TS1 TaxID=2807191 RepID=UPI001B20E2DE|nr:hypothetical protein [Oceanobacillus sp. J11TS1]GIO22187.1 hypothetical protein J11TS1_07680 [Oceanobacillus sp. J11TS1]